MIILTILFSYNRTLTEKIVKFVFKILKKVRFIKINEDSEKKLEDSLGSFHNNASILKNNLALLLKSSIMVFMQLTFYFSISYCIYRSFGLSSAGFFELFSASVYVATVISIVPLPGAIGGAELGYSSFFGAFFGGVCHIGITDMENNYLLFLHRIWKFILGCITQKKEKGFKNLLNICR